MLERSALLTDAEIPRGTLLIRESPLFVVPSELRGISPYDLLMEELSLLTPEEREEFWNLSYVRYVPHGEAEDGRDAGKALAIFQTNAVSAGENKVGLFPRMARMNHACGGPKGFNAIYSFRPQEGTHGGGILYVHALRNISAGEGMESGDRTCWGNCGGSRLFTEQCSVFTG